jgi:hypothetical protein
MAGTDEDFLSRWSRRKREARSGTAADAAPAAAPPVPATAALPVTAREPSETPDELPPVDELTPESDFTPFMDGKVDPDLRRQALRKLFADPHFNVMDGLDVYIDDYSIPDPMPPEWLGQLAQMAGLGDVPGRLKAEREARELAERQALEQAGAPTGDSLQAAGQPVSAPADAQSTEGQGDLPAVVAGPGNAGDSGDPSVPVAPGREVGGDEPIPARKLGD